MYAGHDHMTSLILVSSEQLPLQRSAPLDVGGLRNIDSAPRPPKRVLGTAHYLCGMFIVPRDGFNSLAVAVLVLIPTIVFLVTVVPKWEIYSFVAVLVLCLCALVSLFCAVSVDPGIIPPVPYDPERQPEVVTINGYNFDCKVCTTCNIVRPPRSSHCSRCDWCVEEFDHHCGVLGSCVARRTFRFFTFFMVFTAAEAAFICIRSVFVLIAMSFEDEGQSPAGRWKIVASFGCVLYTLVGGCCVGSQMMMYLSLGCVNRTTKDCNQNLGVPTVPDIANKNPFDLGFACNLFQRFCSALPPSVMRPCEDEKYIKV